MLKLNLDCFPIKGASKIFNFEKNIINFKFKKSILNVTLNNIFAIKA